MRSFATWGFVLALMASAAGACRPSEQAPLKELQRAHAGMLDVVLLSAGDALRQGKDSFVLEFRNPDGQLLDVGTVSVNATMAMAGMAPMFGVSTVKETATKGRYEITSDLNMAGTWRFAVEWNGPAGRGSTSLSGPVL
jgi:hypothetical protein